jgi:ketosteroid isomerase-like protein
VSTEENKELVRRGFKALNERNWIAFDALCAPDFVLHNGSMTIQGYEPYKQFLSCTLRPSLICI